MNGKILETLFLGFLTSLIIVQLLMITGRKPSGNLARYAVILVVMTAINTLLQLIPGYAGTWYETLTIYPIMLLLFSLVFRESIFDSTVYVLLVIPIALVMELVSAILFPVIFSVDVIDVWGATKTMNWLLVLENVVLFIMLLLLPLREFIEKHWQYVKSGSIVLVNFYVFIVYGKVASAVAAGNMQYTSAVQIVLMLFCLGSNLFMVIYLFRHIGRQERMKQLDGLKAVAVPLLDEIKARQHDYKNHLQVLIGLVCSKERFSQQQIMAYLNRITQDVDAYAEVLRTKNPILGALLHGKKAAAAKMGVRLEFSGIVEPEDYPVEDYDLVAVVGNLLDNAIEAAGPGGEVDFIMGLQEGAGFIRVENKGTLPADRSGLFESGFSLKGLGRGYGLANVKRIVTRYKGIIDACAKDGRVTFSVTFPYRGKTPA